jgi:ferredoxin
MKVTVDRVKCTGLGICEAKAPEAFEIDEEGSLVILVDDVPADQAEQIRQAVDGCPTAALRLVRE